MNNYNLYKYTYECNNIPYDWRDFFNDKNTKEIIKNISEILYEDNKNGEVIFPELSYIWSPFYYTGLSELKVVFLGDQPNKKTDNNMSNKYFTNTINTIKEKYKEEQKDIEISNKQEIDILDYCNQGIFFMNSSLTIKLNTNNKNSYKRLWHMFLQYFVEYISLKKENLIFILWGGNKIFSKYVDKRKNYIIENTYPTYIDSFYSCNNLQQCNDILIKKNINPIIW